jgi:hypothetical protein
MADFNISITNSFNMLGAGPSSLWNSHNWNEFVWGEGTEDMIHGIFKVLTNSQSLSDAIAQKSITKLVANTQSIAGDMTEQQKLDGGGWNYVFVKPSIDAEDRSLTDWDSADTGDVATWTCQAAGSTTWTEV